MNMTPRSLGWLLPCALLVTALPAAGMTDDVEVDEAQAVSKALVELVGRQEGPGNLEWPYEGVYRVKPYEEDFKGNRQIPYGYRVGGTAITASAILQAPGYDEDKSRQASVARAVDFVTAAIESDHMDPDYDGGYDVRGWGYIYAIDFLVRLEDAERIPKELKKRTRKALAWYISALEEIEIPENGGWSYSRRGPLDKASSTSPFMTGPALQALFSAKRAGHKVDKKILARALDALERGRSESGEISYSIAGEARKAPGMLPGSVGRMLVTENTLYLAGRSSLSRVRGAIDAFLVHWEWLDKRRAQNGTHIKPYGVAPYYFYYAHFYAAQAIEQLPEAERAEYRRRLTERLFDVRMEDGLWNDRVFPRTANYGTAIAVLALTMSQSTVPARME